MRFSVIVGFVLAALFFADVPHVAVSERHIGPFTFGSSRVARWLSGTPVDAQTIPRSIVVRRLETTPIVPPGASGEFFNTSFTNAQGYTAQWNHCPTGDANESTNPDSCGGGTAWDTTPRAAGNTDDLGNTINIQTNSVPITTSIGECLFGDQILAAANYGGAGAGGGMGFRHCTAETLNGSGGSTGSGISVTFAASTTTVYARWYQRWRTLADAAGYAVPGPNYTGKVIQSKDLYWNVGNSTRYVITGFQGGGPGNWYTNLRGGVTHTSPALAGSGTTTTGHGDLVTDGAWHCLQLRYTVDTSASPYNGIIKQWRDGVLAVNVLDANFNGVGAGATFTHVALGSNKQNFSDGLVDYDDFSFATDALPACLS